MLSSIHPLGERAKGNRFGTTAAIFILASTLGGIATGFVAGVIGLWPAHVVGTPIRLGLLVAVTLGAAAAEARGWRLPCVRRQVNEEWLTRYRSWVYAGGYGAQLGAGVTTIITSAAVFLALAAMLAVGSVPLACLIGAVFGASRGLSILAGSSITTSERLFAFHRALHARAPAVRATAAASLVAAALGTVAVTALGG